MLKKQEYDKSVDWWCLGAVTYEMMYGLVSPRLLALGTELDGAEGVAYLSDQMPFAYEVALHFGFVTGI